MPEEKKENINKEAKKKISFKEFYNKLDKEIILNVPIALISTIFILISLNYSKTEIIEMLSNIGYENITEVLEHIYKVIIGVMGAETGLFGAIPSVITLKEKADEKLNDYFLVNGLSLDILNEEELEELQFNIKNMINNKNLVRCKNKEQ